MGKVETNLDVVLKAGSLLVIEHGAYSDRTTLDPVRVLKDVNMKDLAAQFRASWLTYVETRKLRASDWDYFDEEADRTYGPGDPKTDAFLPWLVKAGYVEDAGPVRRWHIGSYSEFDPKWHQSSENDNG